MQAGLAIHDVMQSLTSPVHTICLGHCESMAAVLLAAGFAGERSAMPNARIMIHQPIRHGGGSSNAKQLAISAAGIERSRRRIAELLARDTGRSVDDVLALIEYDHVCDAHEALTLGLVDRVLTEPGSYVTPLGGTAHAGAPSTTPSAAPVGDEKASPQTNSAAAQS